MTQIARQTSCGPFHVATHRHVRYGPVPDIRNLVVWNGEYSKVTEWREPGARLYCT